MSVKIDPAVEFYDPVADNFDLPTPKVKQPNTAGSSSTTDLRKHF